ncbi:MAG: TMEM43 family protein [Planctomycetota bacterium]
MAGEEKNRFAGILIGPVMVCLGLTAIWKNETRFDYHRAAKGTGAVSSLNEATSGEDLSFTGPMDQSLNIKGGYVESFTGFLSVDRYAEIYCWDKETSDDTVRWNLEWMSSVESNSRNSGIRQQLSSKSFQPAEYEVGGMTIEASMMEFVDASNDIQPSQLKLKNKRRKLSANGRYFKLYKNKSDGLGDERVSYSGVPVPAKATYFGRYDGEHGVADTSHKRDGFVNMIIQDTGILHHIVAGDRETALATMKAHIGRLKWIVRGIASVVVLFGIQIFFSTFVGFLFPIPIIGRLAEMGVLVVTLVIGLPLIVITMVASYIVAHPFILVLIIAAFVFLVYWSRRRGQESHRAIKADLDQQFGRILPLDEVKDLEFIELARMATKDGEVGTNERKFLKQWAKKHRWDESKFESMLMRAKLNDNAPDTSLSDDDHLGNLVRLSLADGTVTPYEIKSIKRMATNLGHDSKTVSELIDRVRRSAMQTSSAV